MAILNPGYSLVLDIMRLFQRGFGARDAWTAEEIWAQINKEVRGWRWYKELYFRRRGLPQDIRDPVKLIGAILDSLAELGVVSREGERETSSGFERWRSGPALRPPELPPSGDGGDVPGAPNEGDGEGGEGGGLTETLSHPILFALDQEDFEQLVDGLFDGGGQ